ncbi:MAG: polysaccharide biosynthesis C-terminal domain-containing protein [Deltaproteobacteria bacterium]|nr:polysaccharide biosynthesis C-terminal domain-containing protein [Deltaproteobacteria bacterium]
MKIESCPAPLRERITGEGPLTPVILRLAGPVILMMYLQGAYNIIDTIWVGRLLGKIALAGIAAGGFVLWSLFGLSNLVAVGSAAMVARRIGESDLEQAETVATRSLAYSFGLAVAIGSVLWFLTPFLFQIMGTGWEVTAQGSEYLRMILLGCPLIFLSFQIFRTFQAAGDTVTPMWLMSISLVVNTALDPVLMLGAGGLPAMGLKGAALATVLSRLLFVVLGLRLLWKRERLGSGGLSDCRAGHWVRGLLPTVSEGVIGIRSQMWMGWDWKLLFSIIRIGLPEAVSQTLFPAVYMVMTRLPASYGARYVAALRIGHTVEGVSFFLAMGFAIAAATCIGQNLGAEKPERADRAGWIAAGVVAAILLIFSGCFFLFSHRIAAIFSDDPGTVQAGAAYLEILAVSQAFMGIEIVLGGAFSGAGDTIPPMAIFVPLNLARIPLAYLLTGPAGLGVNGVWWAISGSTILKGLAISYWFARGRWKEKKV